MNEKPFNKFVYGTQYYRAPTPLPEEWEYDLTEMDKTGIDTIQLRIQWRWNEPVEGKYEFDDIDRLFELSEKYGKKVIIKFMMETAPDYIFHKYGGTRKDMNGLPISPGAHGAYYIGGWWPCFENPDVMRKALDFVSVVTNRYKSKENLILWNIWNEPVTRPIGDCGCEHSIKNYRTWLKNSYRTIDELNKIFGKKWESFDTINPPGMSQDYAELFLWRRWAMCAVAKRLENMYRTVRAIESSRPIMCHVGACSVLQDTAGSGSDDILNSSKMDFYGTSFPTAHKFTNIIEESWPFMICDWLRCVSEYFWIYELYPDWGDWNPVVTMGDYKLKVWSTLACGAKGLLYWQYRAERLGNENNLAGLVNIDGSFKDISSEARKIRVFINENEDFLVNAQVKHDGVGILYSLESDLINRIENTGKGMWNFDLKYAYPYLYKKALCGVYALFRELGLTTVWVDTRRIKESLKQIKVLYIPECFIMPDEVFQVIREFSERGGCVIAEEGIGLRKENTWLNSTWPEKHISEFFGVSIVERVSTICNVKDSLSLFGKTISALEYISYLKCDASERIGKWQDGRPGATRKNNLFYIGTSLGASFHDNYADANESIISAMSEILKHCGINKQNELPDGVYERTLFHEDTEMHFIFNRTGSEQKIKTAGGKCVTILAKDVAFLKEQKKCNLH